MILVASECSKLLVLIRNQHQRVVNFVCSPSIPTTFLRSKHIETRRKLSVTYITSGTATLHLVANNSWRRRGEVEQELSCCCNSPVTAQKTRCLSPSRSLLERTHAQRPRARSSPPPSISHLFPNHRIKIDTSTSEIVGTFCDCSPANWVSPRASYEV